MAADLALRLRACERVRQAVDTLAQLGPVSQVIDHCAVEAAEAADLDRLLLSRIERGALVVERLHLRAASADGDGDGDGDAMLAELRRSAVRLSYPLLECELLRRRQARLVDDIDRSQPNRYAFHATMDWAAYVAVPIVVDGSVVGFLHGDRASGRRPPTQLDADALEHFASGFALVFERAVLRRRLRDQRREIRRIATWAEARTGELSDSAIDLSAEHAEEQDRGAATHAMLTEDGDLGVHLTAREVDVLRLMADGMTNADIARALFVSQGTVKFHVKNILRKMQAANRADASSRYLRLTLRNGSAAGRTPTLR
jgi:DNA-binding CsgD family transcriptional regulator